MILASSDLLGLLLALNSLIAFDFDNLISFITFPSTVLLKTEVVIPTTLKTSCLSESARILKDSGLVNTEVTERLEGCSSGLLTNIVTIK